MVAQADSNQKVGKFSKATVDQELISALHPAANTGRQASAQAFDSKPGGIHPLVVRSRTHSLICLFGRDFIGERRCTAESSDV